MPTTGKKVMAAAFGLALLLLIWENAPARWAALLLVIIVLALMFKALPRVGGSSAPA